MSLPSVLKEQNFTVLF